MPKEGDKRIIKCQMVTDNGETYYRDVEQKYIWGGWRDIIQNEKLGKEKKETPKDNSLTSNSR